MLFDCPKTLDELRRIVARLVANSTVHDDLIQEALVHLWIEEYRHPGHSRSWYLRSCYFHLKNYLRKGRSVDSTKRRLESSLTSNEFETGPEAEPPVDLNDGPDPNGDVLSAVAQREVLALLSNHLDWRGREILSCLADGLSAREIALKLKLSHTAVIKRRQGIAARACKLGLAPHSNGPTLSLHTNQYSNGASKRDLGLASPRCSSRSAA
jgi:RNA polymerase sigma factor (sigma-70 family)